MDLIEHDQTAEIAERQRGLVEYPEMSRSVLEFSGFNRDDGFPVGGAAPHPPRAAGRGGRNGGASFVEHCYS